MTNDLLIYDGRRGEWFRVVDYRPLNRGDRYIGGGGCVGESAFNLENWKYTILEPCSPPPPSQEWLDLREAAQLLAADGISRHNGASIFTQVRILQLDAVADSLAALPSTEPQERYVAQEDAAGWWVKDSTNDTEPWVISARTEQDAKSFAALKNSQEAE